jgi:hypothetical protein
MDDAMDWDAEESEERPQQIDCYPISWITTDELEDELFNAIMIDFSASNDEESEDFGEIDDYLSDYEDNEDYEDEADQRRSTLSLLATLRLQLAELLGGPAAESCG